MRARYVDRGRRRGSAASRSRAGVVRDETPAARDRRPPLLPDAPITPARGSSRGWTSGRATCCCPGYGWLFPVAGGTINLGAGLLNTFKGFKDVSAQRLFNAFATMLPAELGHLRGDRGGAGPVRAAADELEPVAAGGARACCWSATPPAP